MESDVVIDPERDAPVFMREFEITRAHRRNGAVWWVRWPPRAVRRRP